MNKTALMAGLAALALSTGACTTMDSQRQGAQASSSMVERISGELSYRERIALPPGALMEIVVTDITNGSDQELILSREQMAVPGRSVPIPFSIDVSKRNLSDGPLYGLRAFLKDAEGTVLFRTTSPFLLNLQNENVDIGTLMLSQTSPDDQGVLDIAGVQDGEWRVTQFNFDVAPAPTAPTMTFGADGRVFGSTSCNRFNGEYTLDGNAISLGPLAVTKMACEAGLMEQEHRFLEVLNGLNRVSLDSDGRLVMEASKDLTMVAERNR